MINVLPTFKHVGVILDHEGLAYNPVGDIIFPSIIQARGFLKNATERYFMYYAPHDAPAGICVATADRVAGPWTERPGNPRISNIWEPHYKVSHVSSPHAVWNPEESKLFLYFHGENEMTRLATSEDGVHFEYERVVFTVNDFNDTTECSYARCFRYDLPGTDSKWIMMLTGNVRGNRCIFFAHSPDGRNWTPRRKPLIAPPPGFTDVGSPWYFPWKGRHFVLVHAHPDVGGRRFSSIHAFEVDPEFKSSTHAGLVYDRTAVSRDNYRQSDPHPFYEDGKLYLVTNIGRRLHQKIALAAAVEE